MIKKKLGKKRLEKPSILQGEPFLDYMQVCNYLQAKYNINLDDRSIAYRSFWLWLYDYYDIHNNRFIRIEPDFEKYGEDECPAHINAVLRLLFAEYPDGTHSFYGYINLKV